MKDPIPRIQYKDNENKLWNYLFTNLREKMFKHGCKEFINNFKEFEK